jgi:hypothetical protein
VEVEVVLRQVRERDHVERKRVDSTLCERVARRLHHEVGAAPSYDEAIQARDVVGFRRRERAARPFRPRS